MLKSLFSRFENIIVFDVETTGVNPKHDEIIEFAALRVVNKQGNAVIEESDNFLVKLSEGRRLPHVITNLTGITEERIDEEGIEKEVACERITGMLGHKNSLLAAYNAQFDLCFLYHFLDLFGEASVLKNVKMLDVLTVYKDRKPYPHKLGDAVAAYSIDGVKAHCAGDDTRATYEILCKMGEEDDDLENYINLFGFNPKYGVSGTKISSVKYLPQGYDMKSKLYEI